MMSKNIMPGNRWNNLDFMPPVRRPGGAEKGRRGGEPRGTAEPSGGGIPIPVPRAAVEASHAAVTALLPPEVAQARSAYLLRNYAMVVELLEPRLQEDPELPGGQRLLGQALARLNRPVEAAERLREAIQQAPVDGLARASLASLLLCSRSECLSASALPFLSTSLTSSLTSEAVTQLEAALAEPASAPVARSALHELLGAARWACGQEALREGSDPEAARQFAAARVQFAAAAQRSGAARRALPQRQAAVFVGEAVALLLSGQVEAAQRLFSRSRVPAAAARDPVGQFAAGLYELCEELVRLPAGERTGAAAPLRGVVLETRLAVGFYDGRQAVTLAWLDGIS